MWRIRRRRGVGELGGYRGGCTKEGDIADIMTESSKEIRSCFGQGGGGEGEFKRRFLDLRIYLPKQSYIHERRKKKPQHSNKTSKSTRDIEHTIPPPFKIVHVHGHTQHIMYVHVSQLVQTLKDQIRPS